MSRTVAFATLGCRLNQVDTRELETRLEGEGFRTVGLDAGADVVVVNTCAVTARAELSDRQAIRRARRANRSARLVVTGCWAQTSPAAVAAVPGVDAVVGNADKSGLPRLIADLLQTPQRSPDHPRVVVSDVATARLAPLPSLPSLSPTAPSPTAPGPRARAFVKVQDGCAHRCAFCIVPLARGPSRSVPLPRVVQQAQALVDVGHLELVLTGVDLGHYGADLIPRTTLAALIRALSDVRGLRWLRLSSLLPAYLTPELFAALERSAVVVPHFHVPLQSGSDRVLRAMRRPYTVDMYRAVAARLTRTFERPGLGADVIVGFPGETDADFDRTRALVEELPFTYLHVFPYSDRPGTEAARRGGRPPAAVVTRRAETLRAIAAAKARAFAVALIGRTEDALVLERRARDGRLVGLTSRYVEVTLDGPDALTRTMVRLRITASDAGGTRAVLADEHPK